MAASISLRSYLLVSPKPSGPRKIVLEFPDIKLNHTWDLDSLPLAAFADPAKAKRFDDRLTSLDPELVAALEPHIATVSTHLPEKARHQHHAAASCFLYLLLSLGTPSMPGCAYTMRSTIPIGAGLGSSASISVCLATAILLQNSHISSPSTSSSSSHTLDTINAWAFVGEICIHGTPSGVDNTVATKGRAVLFKRTISPNSPPQPPTVTPLHDFPTLPLLLVDTRQPRSTAALVASVGQLYKTHPRVVGPLLDAIDACTEEAHALLTRSSSPASATNTSAPSPATLHTLGTLVQLNQSILSTIGVSHPKLERVRELVETHDVGRTKLTGAGGGGCAIVLLKPEGTAEMRRAVETELESEGFGIHETVLGGKGVGLAGAGNSSNREAFRDARGSEEVEKLVGVGGENGQDRMWRFWD